MQSVLQVARGRLPASHCCMVSVACMRHAICCTLLGVHAASFTLLLHVVCCMLCAACCLFSCRTLLVASFPCFALLVASSLLHIVCFACCMLLVASSLLHAVWFAWCTFHTAVACRTMHVACCPLHVVRAARCLLLVSRCCRMLFGLHVACCLFSLALQRLIGRG